MPSTSNELIQLPVNEFNKNLTFCWICQRTLADAGGEPHYIRNTHHIIPQAYGGVDGPTVSLCTSHHDLLHFIALRLISGKTYQDLTRDLSTSEFQRIMYLASRIRLAAQYSKNDPNKKIVIPLKINNQLNTMLSEIAKFKGKSKETIVKNLILEAHRHLFPRKK